MITLLVLVLAIGFGLFVWAAWFEPRHLAIRRYDVQLANLKAPVVAVVIGDIQANTYHWPARRLASVFAKLAENEQPDLTLWLGDYYNGHTGGSGDFLKRRPRLKEWVEERYTSMEDIAAAMSHLNGRLGAFAVLGNHDWAWSADDTTSHLAVNDITVLRDDLAHISDVQNDQSLQILGYEDLSSGLTPDYEKVHKSLDNKAAQIALSHSPDAFPKALGGPALMLSGHTHGGQVRLPFVGAVILPLEYPQYDRGWFSERHRRLFVTTGVGTSLPPFRFMCRPEVVVLNLVPAEG